LTPPNNLSAVSLTPVKNVRLFGYFSVTRINRRCDKFFPGVVDIAEQFIAGIREYLREFSKIVQNGPNGIPGGLGDTDS
jgi:hypothetical protein